MDGHVSNLVFPVLSTGLIIQGGFWDGTGANIVSGLFAVIVALIYVKWGKNKTK
ncbi:MAG: hypothetical protein K0U41_00495 [Gammaproteobacteria bacterium]|nr:hypothetical protein [Gammaproteobacteria bacterium]